MQLTLDFPEPLARFLIERSDKEQIPIMEVLSRIVESSPEYEEEEYELAPNVLEAIRELDEEELPVYHTLEEFKKSLES